MKRAIFLILMLPVLFFFSATKLIHFSPEIIFKGAGSSGEGLIDSSALEAIAEGPLHFIGNGGEAIAFVTSNDEYVLKFFLKKHLRPSRNFESKKQFKKLVFGKRKVNHPEKVFEKYIWAYKYLPLETGVIAVHSPKVKGGDLPSCTLIDYRNKEHKIDLNQFSFVLQKKAKIIENFTSLSDFEKVELKLLELFETLAKKGFISNSFVFNPANFAILNDKAVMIDLGKIDFAPEGSSYEIEEAKLQKRYYNWKRKQTFCKLQEAL
jgi:hypothetical protein